MKSQRIVPFVLVSVIVIALLAACSGGTVGGTKAPASGSSGGKTFNVTATEFQFAPNKFDATVGQKLTFKVTNKGTVEQESILNSNGNVAKESSNNGLLQHLKKKLSGSDSILGLYRSVRDGFSGRGRYTASRGPDCCAIFKKRNDIATMSQ